MTAEFGAETIGARLAWMAKRRPDDVAIVEHDARITFAALDAAAAGIGQQLLAATARGPGLVGLFFDGKLRAIESIFGVCKSGHTYVPLDAGDPEERLRFVLDDCEPVALLTEASLWERARAIAPAGCPVIDVERRCPQHSPLPLPGIPADARAYVYYTSGSTGQPKGASQTHGNLLFFADAYAKALQIGTGDRLSLLNSLGFAAANQQVFRGLLHGATLCTYDLRRDGILQLADWLDRERITVLHAAPTVFRELASRLAPGRLLPHLRAIHLGGDTVYASDVELFRRCTLAHCVFVNQLASTEAGVIAQNIIGHHDRGTTGAVVPVGRCIDGVRVEIRRDDGSIAGPDEVGEMIVCGAHLSPGYWRRPELDAAAFGADPRHPGWRQYRSGDLGRIDAAGNLHFLGRRGSRVKIRGHSVDLMEIEAALAACPDVRQAAVVATGDEAQPEPVRLIAHVATRPDAARDPSTLRRQLAARLPLYMLPTGIVYVDALPLTVNGKIDRKALARIESTTVRAGLQVDTAQDDVEATVARAFEQLLHVERVGRDDDFFLLGGDSLLGVELQARLRAAFGVQLGELHQDATVAGIAASIRRTLADSATRSRSLPVLVPLWQSGSEVPLFIVHGRHGQAFVSPHFMHLLGNEQPVWVFQARGLDGLSEPHAAIEGMAAEYLAAMSRQRPHGPYFLGALCAGAYIAAAMARQLRAAGEDVLPLLLLDPPNSVLQQGYAQLSEAQFANKMKARRARGVTAGPVDDPQYMKALQRTALAFDQAIACHRPQPYDGPVYVLSSRQRMEDPVGLRRIFTGRFKRYDVGATHAQALDPRNPVFAAALQRCVGLIRDAAHGARQARTDA